MIWQKMQIQRSRLLTLVFAMSIVSGPFVCEISHAQRRKPALGGNKPPASQPSKNQDADRDSDSSMKQQMTQQSGKLSANLEKFAPENVTMTVKGEGIELVATWFPPIVDDDLTRLRKANAAKKEGKEVSFDKEPGKSTSPFILVHDWGRSRSDLFALGKYLQSKGHAVIIPDLRGHGDSVKAFGMNRDLDHKKFRKQEKASAVADIDQCKRFLQEKNNEGVVNVDLLNVIAVGDSAHLAVAWCLADWRWEPVAGIKQGKDAKSIILFTPTKSFAGSSLRSLIKEPLMSGKNSVPLPMLIVWGDQSDQAAECEKFVKSIRKFRPEAPSNATLAKRWANQDLFHLAVPNSMEGFQLAGSPQAQQIWEFANDFVEQKVMVYKDQFPWQLRGADAVLKARAEQEE